MKFKSFLVCALLGALCSFTRSETVIKILHIQSNPQIRAIWQEAAQKFESAHPGFKVQFDYLARDDFGERGLIASDLLERVPRAFKAHVR